MTLIIVLFVASLCFAIAATVTFTRSRRALKKGIRVKALIKTFVQIGGTDCPVFEIHMPDGTKRLKEGSYGSGYFTENRQITFSGFYDAASDSFALDGWKFLYGSTMVLSMLCMLTTTFFVEAVWNFFR